MSQKAFATLVSQKCDGHNDEAKNSIMSPMSTKPYTNLNSSFQSSIMDIYAKNTNTRKSKNLSHSFYNKKSSTLTVKKRNSQLFNSFQPSPVRNSRNMGFFLKTYLESNKDEHSLQEYLSKKERYIRTP